MTRNTCSIYECKRLACANGWCHMHYRRWLRNGDPAFSVNEQRADRRQQAETHRGPIAGCWEWQGVTNQRGYGTTLHSLGPSRLVHRLVYEAIYGDAPPVVMHSCDNPRCFRPDHLIAGTPAMNMHDMIAKGRHGNQRKTHCVNGHLLDGENLIESLLPVRVCRACKREINRRYEARRAGGETPNERNRRRKRRVA